MAKKSKIKIAPILAACAALLSLVAILLMFAPGITGKNLGTSYTGAEIAFGKKQNDTAILNFSFGNFLPYLLTLAGLALGVLGALGKGGNIVSFIAAAALIAAGVLFFCAVAMTMFNVAPLTGDAADKAINALRDQYSLAAGPIVSGILSCLAGLLMLGKVFVKK